MLLSEQTAFTNRADFETAKSLLKQARLSVPRDKRIRAQIKKLEKKIETSRVPASATRVYVREKN